MNTERDGVGPGPAAACAGAAVAVARPTAPVTPQKAPPKATPKATPKKMASGRTVYKVRAWSVALGPFEASTRAAEPQGPDSASQAGKICPKLLLSWNHDSHLRSYIYPSTLPLFTLPPQTIAMKEYMLSEADLMPLPYKEVENPHSPSPGFYKPSKLYSEEDLEEAAIAKHGSLVRKESAGHDRTLTLLHCKGIEAELFQELFPQGTMARRSSLPYLSLQLGLELKKAKAEAAAEKRRENKAARARAPAVSGGVQKPRARAGGKKLKKEAAPPALPAGMKLVFMGDEDFGM